ncbi:hypothetical protein [Pseudanabaena sp. Chao 1811]|uniref:hypothetical protein n=1 Tax=Pseudanabaena sp. Chao 1811 TaxID=2963092 RepID=UPI0022F3A8BA|nr:hypothetical protein [Pseudanabaena sp. Chao 1811]
MTQLSVMELAKQGDPQAIATLINRSLESKGIHAQAALEGECLKISLQASQIPNQKAVITIIQRGMLILQVEQIKRVKILTYRSDNNYLAWQYEIFLNPHSRQSLPSPVIANSSNLVQDPNMNLVSNPKGVILVQKLSQIQQNLQEYQDIIVRFTDEHVGTVRCLTTLTELIQVISKPSFLFAAVASNPNLRSLLDTIAESSKTDENGDQVITNLSILQPGQQWQKAKVRLVTKIFLEPAQDQENTEVNHQGITLDLQETPPQPSSYPVLESPKPEIAQSISDETITDPVLENSNSEVITPNPPQTEKPDFNAKEVPLVSGTSPNTADALFEDFLESSSLSTASQSSLDSNTADTLFEDFLESPSPNLPPNISSVDKPSSPLANNGSDRSQDSQSSTTVESLFDDFMTAGSANSYSEMGISDRKELEELPVNPTVLHRVNDETAPTDLDDDLFNDFSFDVPSIGSEKKSSDTFTSDKTDLKEDIDSIKSRIPKQDLDKLLLLMDEEDQTNAEDPAMRNQNSDIKADIPKTTKSEITDLGAITIERILGNMGTISLNKVESDSNPSMVTLEDLSGDLDSLGF